MNEKIYKFSYGNKVKEFISISVFALYNLMWGCILLLVLWMLLSKINYDLKAFINDDVLTVVKMIEVYASAVSLFVFVIQAFLPQSVKVDKQIIRINRHCLFIDVFFIFRGFNDTILINQIKQIYRPIDRDKFHQPIPVNAIDWNNMVIIELDNSTETRYYVPVENSEEFIKDINTRVKANKVQ